MEYKSRIAMAGPLNDSLGRLAVLCRNLKESLLRAFFLASRPIPLTEGEISLVKGVFGDEVNLQIVMKYMEPTESSDDDEDSLLSFPSLGFCIGKRAVAMVGKAMHSADYSKETDERFWIFMHEMTHIWQNQVDAAIRRSTCGVYKYSLMEGKKFSDFRKEQQAVIIEEYAMRFLKPGCQEETYSSKAIRCRPEDIGPLLQKVVEDRFPGAARLRQAAEAKRAQWQTSPQ